MYNLRSLFLPITSRAESRTTVIEFRTGAKKALVSAAVGLELKSRGLQEAKAIAGKSYRIRLPVTIVSPELRCTLNISHRLTFQKKIMKFVVAIVCYSKSLLDETVKIAVSDASSRFFQRSSGIFYMSSDVQPQAYSDYGGFVKKRRSKACVIAYWGSYHHLQAPQIKNKNRANENASPGHSCSNAHSKSTCSNATNAVNAWNS